jgi:hypothetical protein
MKKNKKKGDKAIFYLFLTLFFGWILTQFILINQNYLTIRDDEITGLALQIDPFSGLGNFLSNEVSIFGSGYPLWALILAFALVFSVMFNAAQMLSFFRGEEKRGSLIIFSLAISLLATFATPIISWVIVLTSYIGSLGTIVVLVLLAIVIYFYAHRTISERYTELTETATQRYAARNALSAARSGQQQTPRQGGRLFNPRSWFRRSPQAQPQTPQQQAQQQGGRQPIKQRLLQNYYRGMQLAHQQTLREFNSANPNLRTIEGYLNTIRDGSRGIIADIGNSNLSGALVNQIMGLARSINTCSDRMLMIRDLRQLSTSYRRGRNMENWIVSLGTAINNL